MLPLPPARQLLLRLPVLVVGLVAFGAGLALMVEPGLGLGPWLVLDEGVSEQTGLTIGTVVIIVGFAVLALWIPLRERFGIGTILNILLIGLALDATLAVLPEMTTLPVRVLAMAGGVVLVSVATATYIGTGLGPGPRDGLMTGLARRGYRISWVRTGIEIAAMTIGWLLGGTVGVGTVLFAVAIGPIVEFSLPRVAVAPEVTEALARKRPAGR